MIRVTRLNNRDVIINSDQIELMEETPDLVITLLSGRKIVVHQSVEDVISSIISFKRAVYGQDTSNSQKESSQNLL